MKWKSWTAELVMAALLALGMGPAANAELIVKFVYAGDGSGGSVPGVFNPSGDGRTLTVTSSADEQFVYFKVYAVVSGSDADPSNDGLFGLNGAFRSYGTGTAGAYSVRGDFQNGMTRYVAPFDETGSSSGSLQAVGGYNEEIRNSTWNSTTAVGWWGARAPIIDGLNGNYTDGSTGPVFFAMPADGSGLQVGTLKFQIKDLTGTTGGQTTIDFYPVTSSWGDMSKVNASLAGKWVVDGTRMPANTGLSEKLDNPYINYTSGVLTGTAKTFGDVKNSTESFSTLPITITQSTGNNSTLSIPTSYANLRMMKTASTTPGQVNVTNTNSADDGHFTAVGNLGTDELTVAWSGQPAALLVEHNNGTAPLNFGWTSTGTTGSRSGKVNITNTDNSVDPSNHEMAVTGAVVDNRTFSVLNPGGATNSESNPLIIDRVVVNAPNNLSVTLSSSTAHNLAANVTLNNVSSKETSNGQTPPLTMTVTGGGYLFNGGESGGVTSAPATVTATVASGQLLGTSILATWDGSSSGLFTAEAGLTGQTLQNLNVYYKVNQLVNNRPLAKVLAVNPLDYDGVLRNSQWVLNINDAVPNGSDTEYTTPSVQLLGSAVDGGNGATVNGKTGYVGAINQSNQTRKMVITYGAYGLTAGGGTINLGDTNLLIKEGLAGEALNMSGGLNFSVPQVVAGLGTANGTNWGITLHAPVAAGESYANLASQLTQARGSEFTGGTEAIIREGAAASSTDVTMKWRQRATAEKQLPSTVLPPGIAFLASDVTNLQNANGTYVLQMSYNPDLMNGNELALANAGYIYLAYFNTTSGKWENAVLGNTGGDPYQALPWAVYTGTGSDGWAAYRADNPGDLADLLGDWGVDTTHHTVWAVVNHTSEYAVTPEPGTLALLVSAGLAVGLFRYRRKRTQLEGGF